MTRERRHRLGALLVALGVVAVLALGPATRADAAQSRAVLVVDLGNGDVRVHRLSFAGEISGLAALQQAGYAPITKSFGGLGAAICALDIDAQIRGCPGDSTCLLCANPSYWSYHRSVAGTLAFTASKLGPTTTTVRDGDVEAWRWGTGGAPSYVSFASQYPTASTVPAPTVAPPTVAPPTSPATAAISTAAVATTTVAAGAGPTATVATLTPTTGPATTGSSARVEPDPGSGSEGDGLPGSASAVARDREAAAAGPPVVAGGGGGSGAGLAAFGVAVVALLAVIAAVRRRSVSKA